MNCENLITGLDLSKIKIPILVLYTEKDEVVSVAEIKHQFQVFGSSKKFLIEVPNAKGHILIENIIDPETLPFVEKTMKEFLENLYSINLNK